MIKREQIAALIPHAGAMCLIERVTAWDATTIECETATHRDTANPLRKNNRLSAVCGIEYAAQAMAIHGALGERLCEGDTKAKPKMGFLASIRDVKIIVARLDDLEGALTIHAMQLLGEEGRVIYQFKLSAGNVAIMEGRAAVVLHPS